MMDPNYPYTEISARPPLRGSITFGPPAVSDPPPMRYPPLVRTIVRLASWLPVIRQETRLRVQWELTQRQHHRALRWLARKTRPTVKL